MWRVIQEDCDLPIDTMIVRLNWKFGQRLARSWLCYIHTGLLSAVPKAKESGSFSQGRRI